MAEDKVTFLMPVEAGSIEALLEDLAEWGDRPPVVATTILPDSLGYQVTLVDSDDGSALIYAAAPNFADALSIAVRKLAVAMEEITAVRTAIAQAEYEGDSDE